MSTYHSYSKYIQSKLFWIDLIPEGWKVKKVTHSISYKVGFTPESGNPAYYGEGHPWVNISDLGDKVIHNPAKQITDDAIEKYKKSPAKKGSVLYSFKLSVGQVSFAGRDMYTNEAIAAFEESNDLLLSYFYYLAPIAIIQNASENIYGAKILNQEAIGNAKLVVPPIEEQQKIADFLDYKTAQIDTLIAKKEALLLKLQEKRSALITQTVTKGINPDALMKPSGVEWLGNVPAHWEVKRLKNVASYNDESLDDKTDLDYEIQYVDISSVNLLDGITNIETLTFDKAPSRARRIVRNNDIIVSTVRTYLKAITSIKIPPDNMIVSTGFAVIRPHKNINASYVGYLLKSDGFVGNVVAKSVGVSYPAINASDLVRIHLVVPPITEQNEIVSLLNEKLINIDTQKNKIEDVISKLSEYRSALITSAVTGKIDVRDFEVKLEK